MVLNDHRQLQGTLAALRRMCSEIQAEPSSVSAELQPHALLESLSHSLAAHFEVEESAGYFGTVATDQPVLASAIAVLTLEHAEMLESLHGLRAASMDRARWLELPPKVLDLVARLERHERAETQLMRSFFEADD